MVKCSERLAMLLLQASHIDFPDAGTGGQAQELEDVLSSAEAEALLREGKELGP